MTTAMDEDQDWQLCFRIYRRSPNIKFETVFIALRLGKIRVARNLHAHRRIFRGVKNFRSPWVRWLRRSPAKISQRRFGEGNTLEDVDALRINGALNFALSERNHRTWGQFGFSP